MITLSSQPSDIEGLFKINRGRFEDARGLFVRIFCSEDQEKTGIALTPLQINYSRTVGAGSVRGMHFQHPPFAEVKMVTCLYGEILDVAVDLRSNSKTFLRSHGEILSGQMLDSMVIPEGMAHGFQVLSEEAHLLYLHSKAYQPHAEGRLNPIDPALKIKWPLDVRNLSTHDRDATFLPPTWAGLCLS